MTFLRSTSSFDCFNYRLTVGFPLGVQRKTNSLSTWKADTHKHTHTDAHSLRTHLSQLRSVCSLIICLLVIRLSSSALPDPLFLSWALLGQKISPRLRLCLLCRGGRWGSLIHNQPSSLRVIISRPSSSRRRSRRSHRAHHKLSCCVISYYCDDTDWRGNKKVKCETVAVYDTRMTSSSLISLLPFYSLTQSTFTQNNPQKRKSSKRKPLMTQKPWKLHCTSLSSYIDSPADPQLLNLMTKQAISTTSSARLWC